MMNEQLPDQLDPEEEKLAQKLSEVAEQTHANARFVAELEKRLRSKRQTRAGWFLSSLGEISPVLRWAVLMLLLALVLSLSIQTLIPAPQPATENTLVPPEIAGTAPVLTDPRVTPSPSTRGSGYDFRGGKLYLEQLLPVSPESIQLYQLRQDKKATEEQARALAERFGIQGETYTTYNYALNVDNFLISDGKQSLDVYSQRFFTYIADLSKTILITPHTPNDNAEAIIREFLQARGFDFPFRIIPNDFFEGYIIQPLTPDSIPMQYESFTLPTMLVKLDENGKVLRVDAQLIDFDAAPLQEYGIISAQEAFEKLLNDDILMGKMEWGHSPAQVFRDWFRTYPDDEPLAAYGMITKFIAADAGQPALLLLDGIPVTGNIDGLESLEDYTFIKATGQYVIDNDIRKFEVETWDRHIQQSSFTGTLSRQGEEIILTPLNGVGQPYALIDPPSDVPLDTDASNSVLDVSGVIVDGKMFWTFIRYYENSTGGGSGGGLGFYRLNLSGTPVPFPTPTTQPDASQTSDEFLGIYVVRENDTLTAIALNLGITVEELKQLNALSDDTIFVGQQLLVPISEPVEEPVEDLRGYLSISINNQDDGTSTKHYQLEVVEQNGSRIYNMKGPALSELDPYQGLPILVTGTIDTLGTLMVDSYKIPYPDLQFQIIKGTQSARELEGQNVIVFTTEDGQSYVEFLVTNPFPLTAESFTGYPGDLLQQEVLILPEESFGGLPVAHVYQSAIVQEGGPEMEIQANRIPVYNESEEFITPTDVSPPNLTITQVELVYFVSNPYYQVTDPNYSLRSPYLQPAWRFQGRYDNGASFDMLIQALKQELLLPELAPGITPG